MTRLLDAEEDAVEQACRSSKGDENNGLLYTTQDGENNSPAAEYGKSCIPSTSDDDVETTILIAVLGLTLVCCFCSLCYVSYRYRYIYTLVWKVYFCDSYDYHVFALIDLNLML